MVANFTKPKLFVTALGLFAIVGAGVVGCSPSTQPQERTMEASFVTDVSDDRKLAGIAQNIFIGKVVSEAGTKKLGRTPETQFNVEVVENIKGNLSGTVVVNQQGGYENKEKKNKVLVEGDDLLEPGKVYLFATRFHEGEKWHALVPVAGDVLIKDDVERTKIKERFLKAVKEEIPFKE